MSKRDVISLFGSDILLSRVFPLRLIPNPLYIKAPSRNTFFPGMISGPRHATINVQVDGNEY
jgi:hypothetical protein